MSCRYWETEQDDLHDACLNCGACNTSHAQLHIKSMIELADQLRLINSNLQSLDDTLIRGLKL